MLDFTVFIADDDEDDFYIIREAFIQLKLSHRVEHIRDGRTLQDQLIRIEKNGLVFPHLILMNINMPGTGGLKALELIKSNPSYRHIPVIIYSSSSSEQKGKSIGLEAEAVLLNGWDFTKVIAFVEAVDRFLRYSGSGPGFAHTIEDPRSDLRTFLF